MDKIDLLVQEMHQDLLQMVLKRCEKHMIIISNPEIGFPLCLEGEAEYNNTHLKVVKGNGNFFEMYINLEGTEKKRELEEIADFFVEYLRQSIEVDMKFDMFKMVMEGDIIQP